MGPWAHGPMSLDRSRISVYVTLYMEIGSRIPNNKYRILEPISILRTMFTYFF